jgi:hypothetical protein
LYWFKTGIFCEADLRQLLKVKTPQENVGFEVLTAVTLKRTLFWEVLQCSPV